MLASARLKEKLEMGLMSKFGGPVWGDLKDKEPALLEDSHLDPQSRLWLRAVGQAIDLVAVVPPSQDSGVLPRNSQQILADKGQETCEEEYCFK